MGKYKIAVFGTTVLAAGVAEMLGEETIIIEKSESAATDCAACINMPYAKLFNVGSEKTRQFYEEIEKRGLIGENGTVHTLPIAGVLAKRFIKAKILLSTEVISIKRQENCYEIVLFNIDGFSKIYAEYILDTTPMGINTEAKAMAKKAGFKKYLRAVINGKYVSGITEPGRFADESVYSVSVQKNEKYSEAMHRLHESWQKYAERECYGCELAAIAAQFAYIYEAPLKKQINKNYTFMPSASFENLDKAYEEGIHATELFM